MSETSSTGPDDRDIEAYLAMPGLEGVLFDEARALVEAKAGEQDLVRFAKVLSDLGWTTRAWAIRKAASYLLAFPELGLSEYLSYALWGSDDSSDLWERVLKGVDSFYLLEAGRIEAVSDLVATLKLTGHGLRVGDVVHTTGSVWAPMTVLAVDGARALALLPVESTEYEVGRLVSLRDEDDAESPYRPIRWPLEAKFFVNDSPVAGQDGFAVERQVLVDCVRREAAAGRAQKFAQGEGAVLARVSDEDVLSQSIEALRADGIEFMVSGIATVVRGGEGDEREPRQRVAIAMDDAELELLLPIARDRGASLCGVLHHDGRAIAVIEGPVRRLWGLALALRDQAPSAQILGRTDALWRPVESTVSLRPRGGALVAKRNAVLSEIGYRKLGQRNRLFIEAGEAVFAGMVIGECPDERDEVIDLGEVRYRFMDASDAAIASSAKPQPLSLVEALLWLGPDETLEVTPSKLRIWKRSLDVDEGEEFSILRA